MPSTVIPLLHNLTQLADYKAGYDGVFQNAVLSSLEPPTVFKLRIDHLIDPNASTFIPDKSSNFEFSAANINPYIQAFDPPQNFLVRTQNLRDQENNETKLSKANLPGILRTRIEKILKLYDADITEINKEKIFAVGTHRSQGYSTSFSTLKTSSEQCVLLKIFIEPFKNYAKEGDIVKYLGNKLASSCDSFPKLIGDPHNFEGTAYLVLEYADGENLSCYFKRSLNSYCEFTKEEILFCGIKLAKAFELQHSLGILHLDIKPTNCMLSAEGRAFVIDQGGAQIIDKDLAEYLQIPTLNGPFSITPNYAAPEQLDQELYNKMDQRTDIYGLGYTLYALLTGKEPFSKKVSRDISLQEIIEAKREILPEDPNIDPPLYKLLMRMTHPEMFMRPDSMRHVHEAISLLVNPERPKIEKKSFSWLRLIGKPWGY